MAALLAKFRIEFSSVVVIPDVTKRASETSRARLDSLLSKLPADTIPEELLLANKEKTNRHLRLSELLQAHSKESEIIFMTLPMPRKGHVSAALYLAWLENRQTWLVGYAWPVSKSEPALRAERSRRRS